MIQIIGYRYVANIRTNSMSTQTKFLDRKWRAESVPDLFARIDDYLSLIPQNEHWNLHYTIARCQEKTGRILEKQTTIPWDIDGIDMDKIDHYHDIILTVLGMKYDEVGIVCSGNGLHYLIETDVAIRDVTYFNATQLQYGIIADKINLALRQAGLAGSVDRGIWCQGHTLRLPNTENRKTEMQGYKGKNSITQCYMIQPRMVVQIGYALHLQERLAIPAEGEAINPLHARKFSNIDTESVLSECLFLKYCKDFAPVLKEELWYSMISLVCRLEDGVTLCHNMSKDHPGYNAAECELKIQQSFNLTGPHLCTTINNKWGGCRDCPHFGKVSTALLLKDPDFISTKDNGFYNMKLDKHGNLVKGQPNYDDLVKFFRQQHDFIVNKMEQVFIWNGIHWQEMFDIDIKAFAEEHFDPSPTSGMCNEFLQKIHRTNVQPKSFFETSTERKINLVNGILDFSQGYAQLLPSSKDIAFMYCTQYKYDPLAECPLFDRFLQEITCNDSYTSNFLLEFIAYALMDTECKEQIALILKGEGSNGKSTFIEVIKALVGREAYSILNLEQIKNEQHAASLQGKLFNLSEETPKASFAESSHIKNAITGGEIPVKIVYKPPFHIRNRAKMIVATNTVPPTADNSYGFHRRFKIIPFDASFKGKAIDKNLLGKLIAEMPGILNRVLEAFKRYSNQDGFTVAKKVEDESTIFQEENNISTFFEDYLVAGGPEDYVSTAELYRIYEKEYCTSENIRYPISPARFGKEFSQWITLIQINARRVQRKINKHKTWCYEGIKLAYQAQF